MNYHVVVDVSSDGLVLIKDDENIQNMDLPQHAPVVSREKTNTKTTC